MPTIRALREEYGDKMGRVCDDGGPPEDKWNDPDVRGALYGSQGRVCAYCQREASDSRGDVEHYRPKSSYRLLMYELSNFFVSCRICNSNRKGRKFPLEAGASPASDSDPQAIRVEPRLLLDPANDPVEDWVRVDYDHDLCEVGLSDTASDDEFAARRVPFTSDFFWLNVDNEITTDRFETINEAMEEALLARDGDPHATEHVRRMASRFERHGQAVRRMLAERCPGVPLPTPREELEWYIASVLGRADRAVAALGRVLNSSQKKDAKRKRDESLWALAVIWADPPGDVDPGLVQEWLRTSSHYDAICEKREQLARTDGPV